VAKKRGKKLSGIDKKQVYFNFRKLFARDVAKM
jgi:hypothetical protein